MRPDNGQSHEGDEKAYDVNAPSDYRSGDDSDSRHSSEEAQAGVKRIEAVSKAWTLVSLTVAYVGYVSLFKRSTFEVLTGPSLMLIANITSLEIQVTSNLTFYATSSFAAHSLLSTIAVVQGVVSGKCHT